jgi:hypothetical protein
MNIETLGNRIRAKSKPLLLLLAPQRARDGAKRFADAALRKADALVRAEAFVVRAVRRRARLDRFGVERGEVIAFEIPVDRDFPVSALDLAAAEQVHSARPSALKSSR